MMSVHLRVVCLKESVLVIMIEQELFDVLPKMTLCEAKVGRDNH